MVEKEKHFKSHVPVRYYLFTKHEFIYFKFYDNLNRAKKCMKNFMNFSLYRCFSFTVRVAVSSIYSNDYN